jgi:uncharacterized protein YndB with AHSA1/START domain
MEAIKHYLNIGSTPERVFQAITTEDGLKSWWAKQSNARPRTWIVNTFPFGKFRHEMEVTEMVPFQKIEWQCITSI